MKFYIPVLVLLASSASVVLSQGGHWERKSTVVYSNVWVSDPTSTIRYNDVWVTDTPSGNSHEEITPPTTPKAIEPNGTPTTTAPIKPPTDGPHSNEQPTTTKIPVVDPNDAKTTKSPGGNPAHQALHNFDFLFDFNRLLEATLSLLDRVDKQVEYLKATRNFFASLVEDEGKRIRDLKDMIVREHKTNLDPDEMFDRLVPQMITHIYRCTRLYNASQKPGETQFGQLFTKIGDLLERAYRDIGKIESMDGNVSNVYRISVKKLMDLRKKIQTSAENHKFEEGEAFLREIYVIEDTLKTEMMNVENNFTESPFDFIY